MRRLVQDNPSSLPQLLAQIGEQSPGLLALITAHQEEFLRILNEPITDGGAMDEDDEDDEEGDEEGDEGEGVGGALRER